MYVQKAFMKIFDSHKAKTNTKRRRESKRGESATMESCNFFQFQFGFFCCFIHLFHSRSFCESKSIALRFSFVVTIRRWKMFLCFYVFRRLCVETTLKWKISALRRNRKFNEAKMCNENAAKRGKFHFCELLLFGRHFFSVCRLCLFACDTISQNASRVQRQWISIDACKLKTFSACRLTPTILIEMIY